MRLLTCSVSLTLLSTRTLRTGIPFFPRYNINQEIELIRLAECFGDIGTGERASLVGVCDDERAGGYFGDEYCFSGDGEDSRNKSEKNSMEFRNGEGAADVLSQALQKRIGAVQTHRRLSNIEPCH